MLCCEDCEFWSHAKCYRVKKSAVPEEFYCDVCRPPITEFDFSNVENQELRAALEEDRDRFGFKPGGPTRKRVKPGSEYGFKLDERVALERLWKIYAAAHEEDRRDMIEWIAQLYSMPVTDLEQHFVLMAEDVLSGAKVPCTTPESAPDAVAQVVKKSSSASGTEQRSSFSKSVQGDRTTRPKDGGPSPLATCVPTAPEDCCRSGCNCWDNMQECLIADGATNCECCGCSTVGCSNQSITKSLAGVALEVRPLADASQGWHVVVADPEGAKPGSFLTVVTGRVGDSSASLKGYWSLPLRKECREVHLLNHDLVWDMERSVCHARWMRRSCRPSAQCRPVWVGQQLQLGVWVSNEAGIGHGEEVTIGWDRPWDSLVCHVPCACNKSVPCPVDQWYSERNALAESLPVVRERIGTRRTDPPKPRDKLSSLLETTLNPFPDPPENKLSREERKLQQVLKTIEKLERQEERAKASGSAGGTSTTANGTKSPPSHEDEDGSGGASDTVPLASAASSLPVSSLMTDTPMESPLKKSRVDPVVLDTSGSDNAPAAQVLSPPVVPLSSMGRRTPVSAGKMGKKAWMQQFSSDFNGEAAANDSAAVVVVSSAPSPAPPQPAVPADVGMLSPGYGWKKRAILSEPIPDDSPPAEKKAKADEAE